MARHNLKPLSEITEKLKLNGFGYDFRLENKKLVASGLNKKFTPDQIRIVDEYRFEGDTNPDDMSILYAVEATSGERGTVVNGYGPAADQELNDFLMESTADTNKKNAAH